MEAREADYLDRGRAIVVGATGLPPQRACRACHGIDGGAEPAGAFPRLSELGEWYIYKQLHDYASGARPNEIMTPIAQALDEAEIRAVAHYYARQRAPFRPRLDADPLLLQRGGAVAAVGAPERGVAACTFCHGAQGEGMAPTVPPLAGQAGPYVQLQLQLFRSGARGNDVAAVMRDVAAQLSNEEIEALSLYYASLQPPEAPHGAGATP